MIRKFKKKFAQKKAFTLIELIVVIAIIGVLAAILVPTMSGFVDKAQTATDTANARTIYSVAAAELAFAQTSGTAVDDKDAYDSVTDKENVYVKAVLDQIQGIDGAFKITIADSAVTKVVFTPTGRDAVTYPKQAVAPAE